jgi:hypothetical protein
MAIKQKMVDTKMRIEEKEPKFNTQSEQPIIHEMNPNVQYILTKKLLRNINSIILTKKLRFVRRPYRTLRSFGKWNFPKKFEASLSGS